MKAIQAVMVIMPTLWELSHNDKWGCIRIYYIGFHIDLKDCGVNV